eukprot:gene11915-13000_t
MGQSNVTLAVVADNPYGLSGGIIQGKVYLDIRFEEYDLEKIQLKLIGEEETFKAGRSQLMHCTHKFLEKTFILASFRHGYIVRGQYEYPFETLFEVKIVKKVLLTHNVTHKQPLYLLPVQPAVEELLPAYAPPRRIKLYYFDAIPAGRVILGLFTPTSILSPGEQFLVSYVVCNQSSRQLVGFEITVFEEILWSLNTRNTSIRQIKLCTISSSQVDQINLSFPHQRSILTSSEDQQILDSNILSQLKQSLDSMQSTATGIISMAARPTFTGTLVAVRHFINMRVITPYGTNDAEINLPIIIEAPSATIVTQDALQSSIIVEDRDLPSALPTDWAPVVAEPVQVTCQQDAGESEEEAVDAQAVGDIEVIDSITPTVDEPEQVGVNNTSKDHPLSTMKAWLQENNADELTSDDFLAFYQLISNPSDQIGLTNLLVEYCSFFTCQHVMKALEGCHKMVRIEVTRRLLVKCIDKVEKKEFIFSILQPFEIVCLQDSF